MWIGNALITVLNPDGLPNVSANDDSLVLRLDWRGVSTLIAGDLGWLGETRMLDRGEPVRVLVLRVAHHGSRFSSSAAFLDAVQPSFAVISVGARNPFRHPTTEALARLDATGARIYRTDRDGAIVMETDGTRLWITRWAGHVTDVFDLDPEPRVGPPDENTTAPGMPEAVVGRAESGREGQPPSARS
jgi:competence protein ComEC